MNIQLTSLVDLKKDISVKNPHVVLLGAGASRAAFPSGDKNGKILPVMNNMIKVLSLEKIFEKYNFSFPKESNNFEAVYSQLCLQNDKKEMLLEIENTVRSYFTSLELPDTPTLYDHLILSLREKDIIATFNWDPLLWQACRRICLRVTKKVPKLFFLHGCVAIKIDFEEGRKVAVNTEDKNNKYQTCKLLYPVLEKNYSEDPFIHAEWQAIKRYLRNAAMLTIFGYSAPVSDREAINLLQEGWGNLKLRDQEQIEIIDIREEADSRNSWSCFIFQTHCDFHKNFYDSFLAKYPRRTCEALKRQNLYCEFLDDGMTYEDYPRDFYLLRDWVRSYTNIEEA